MCRVETTIVVHPLPEMLLANDLELCDNAFDGDAYNGRVNGFDLQAQEVAILNGDTSLEVLFFLNESDTDDNPIDKTQPFSNLANPELIYYRIQNKTTGCVSDQTGSFSVQVLPIPPLIDIPPHYECDDLASGSDTDSITTFDLRLNDARIEALLGGAAGQYIISYHTSRSAAEDPTPPPPPKTWRSSGPQVKLVGPKSTSEWKQTLALNGQAQSSTRASSPLFTHPALTTIHPVARFLALA